MSEHLGRRRSKIKAGQDAVPRLLLGIHSRKYSHLARTFFCRCRLEQVGVRVEELHDENIRGNEELEELSRVPISLVKQAGGAIVPANEMEFEPNDVMQRVKRVNELDEVEKQFTAEFWHGSVALDGVSGLECKGKYSETVQILQAFLECNLCPPKRGKAYNRLCIDLEKHLRSPEEALRVAERGLQDAWVCAGERFDLMRRYSALAKPPRRWRTPPFKNMVEWKPPEVRSCARPYNYMRSVKSRFANPADGCIEDGSVAQVSVEELVLSEYAKAGWRGMHAETGPISSIVVLTFWDIFFKKTDRAFKHPFQTAPIDLGFKRFVNDRWDSICRRLTDIKDGYAPSIMERRWCEHYGTMARGINWGRHTLDELVELVECIGPDPLANLCTFFLHDFNQWSGGLPDLALWCTQPRKAAKLVEVKGPRDTLSQQQRAWFLALEACGISVEIAKVSDR